MSTSRQRRRARFLPVLVIAASVLVAACGGTSGPSSSNGSESQGKNGGPHVGGTFTIALSQDPKTLDPATMSLADEDTISSFIGAALTDIAPDGSVVPWLAESWEWSDNNKTITFHLRKGVKFQNGHPLTAGDLKATYERDLDPKTGSPVSKDLLSGVQSIEAPDDNTLVFHLDAPNGSLLLSLASPGYLQPVDPAELQKWGDKYGQHPVSVGPYMLKDWTPGQSVTLVRNPDYNWAPKYEHQGPAYLQEIVFKIVPQAPSQMAAFDSGQLSMLSAPPENWQKYENNPNVHFFKMYSGRVFFLQANMREPMFQDPRVRLALNYGIDRDAVVQGAFNGHATPGWSPLHPALPGYWKGSEGYYKYDLAKAKSLLEQAGFTYQGDTLTKDGKPVELRLDTRSTEPFGLVAQVVQAQLQKLGIKTKIESYETSAALDKLARGDYDLSISSFAWTGDPGPLLAIELKTGGSLNASPYQSQAFDDLLNRYQQSVDPNERTQLMQQLQEQFLKDVPWAMLAYSQQGIAVQGKYQNVKVNPTTLGVIMHDVYEGQ